MFEKLAEGQNKDVVWNEGQKLFCSLSEMGKNIFTCSIAAHTLAILAERGGMDFIYFFGFFGGK
jgi:hypothetical protein